jgi:multiple sugar transport system permease protein
LKYLRKNEPYLLLFPSFFLLFIFLAYPLLSSILYAFKSYKLTAPNDIAFTGLANFKAVFTDANFGLIMKNTVIWVVLTVGAQFILGFILALALSRPFPFRNIYQAVVFLPWAVSSFVIGLTFRWLFNTEYGPVNDVLLKLGIIHNKIFFLSDPHMALYSVIIAMAWTGIPFFAIMLLAAMQSIPHELYEAAEMDGAGMISRFWNVTFSYIKQTILITLLLRTIWVFSSAELIYIMTTGGPANSSNNLASYMFMKAFASLDYGQAAAIGLFFMVLLLLFAFIFLRLTKFEKAGNL